MKTLKKLRDFENSYLDRKFRIDWNIIKLNKHDSYDHNKMICEVCLWLMCHNIPFATQVRFKTKAIPDIICPTHIRKIIEVRASETDKKSLDKLKRLPEELRKEVSYVSAWYVFNERDLL